MILVENLWVDTNRTERETEESKHKEKRRERSLCEREIYKEGRRRQL